MVCARPIDHDSSTAHRTLVYTGDEDTLTELKNGSVLLSSRIDDPNARGKQVDANITRSKTTRGFARSDDGVLRFLTTDNH